VEAPPAGLPLPQERRREQGALSWAQQYQWMSDSEQRGRPRWTRSLGAEVDQVRLDWVGTAPAVTVVRACEVATHERW
jgi:hypothetical protein